MNPTCPTNYEPDLKVGECKVCAEAGRHGDLIAHKSEKSGTRFIRCTNYDDCGVSYPLPARGKLCLLYTSCWPSSSSLPSLRVPSAPNARLPVLSALSILSLIHI